MKNSEVGGNPCWDYVKDPGNLFLNTESGRQALRRIKAYKITNINYNWKDMYGFEKIQKDLEEALHHKHKTSVYLALEAFVPDNLIQVLAVGESPKRKSLKIVMPIMPPLVIKIIK